VSKGLNQKILVFEFEI